MLTLALGTFQEQATKSAQQETPKDRNGSRIQTHKPVKIKLNILNTMWIRKMVEMRSI
jgi:hypothetical protein